MKYYIIAGEASGDLHAANLIKSIRKNDENANFRAWGGDKMQKQGAILVKHYRDLAFMGFAEVLFNIRTIIQNISFCKNDILQYQPDVIILVDYPGFNLRIAEFAKKNAFRVVYYISPQVWAWKSSRVNTIRKNVDKMLVILPFEEDYYRQRGMKVDFVGHPLLDSIENEAVTDQKEFFLKNQLDERPVVALLPGSRKQEVEKMLNEMLKMVSRFPSYQFIIAGVESIPELIYNKMIGQLPVKVIYNQIHDLLRSSKAALVTSGTATLETALLNTPEVVCYKGNRLSFEIARRIIHVKYISLVNLIMDRLVVKELIQFDLNENNLAAELNLLLKDENKLQQLQNDFKELKIKLGKSGASERAASIIKDFLKD